MDTPVPAPPDKAELRATMRRLRRAVVDPTGTAARIWDAVVAHPAVAAAGRMLVFTSIPGEPDTAPLVEWARGRGVDTRVPEDGVDPTWPDVVVVPGLAFTAAGDRLGQGGGWYDRFLAGVRDDCVTIGVCFAGQLVDALPTEPHDITVDVVVTDAS